MYYKKIHEKLTLNREIIFVRMLANLYHSINYSEDSLKRNAPFDFKELIDLVLLNWDFFFSIMVRNILNLVEQNRYSFTLSLICSTCSICFYC